MEIREFDRTSDGKQIFTLWRNGVSLPMSQFIKCLQEGKMPMRTPSPPPKYWAPSEDQSGKDYAEATLKQLPTFIVDARVLADAIETVNE